MSPADSPSAPDSLDLLRERVKNAPAGPGVYRWLDGKGNVLYVGKAKNLRKRLTSYVQPSKATDGPWRRAFLLQIADFDVTVVNTELEALVLETNLIKELKPKYNVLMKDDKNYVYIRIAVQEPFPRIDIVRKMVHDGAKYFGPKTSAEEARRTLTMLRKVYPFRTCRMEIDVVGNRNAEVPYHGVSSESQVTDVPDQSSAESITVKDPNVQYEPPTSDTSEASIDHLALEVVCRHKDRKTPCLDFHIQQCSAPCVGRRTPEQYYEESIAGVIEFLKGNEESVKLLLRERMAKAAVEKKFEVAAQLRDHLRTLEQKEDKVELVSDTSGDDIDVIGAALLAGRAHVVVLHRRGGKIIGEVSFALSGQPESSQEVITQFLAQFYDEDSDIPPAIVIGEDVEERGVLEQLLGKRRGRSVKILVPERGKKSHLLQLAEKNAAEKARHAEAKWEADKRNTESALEELRDTLNLPTLPERIEGYDISHLGGTETVGSMVVMKHGKAANDQYRSFTIRTLKRGDIDDFWSLKEVLTRRLRRLTESIPEEEKKWNEQGVEFGWARKGEQESLERIHAGQQAQLSADGINYQDYLVARHDGDIAAMARLAEHPGKLVELKSVWVDERFRGGRLGQFIVRKILRGVKKGKVYVTIDPALENYYAELGFRYVIRPPRLFQEHMEQALREHPELPSGIVMLWEAIQNKPDPSFSSRPDLLVIDGGKGQLSAVVGVLKNMQLDIPVIGLAKREEEVFVPGRSDPIIFPKDSQAKFLLMRLRDEAHRSANRHREGRGLKAMKASVLDTVPGIGEQTKQELLKRFKTVAGIQAAADADLKEFLSEAQLEALRAELAYRSAH